MPRLFTRPIASRTLLPVLSFARTLSASAAAPHGQAPPPRDAQAVPASAVERLPATRPVASVNVEIEALLIRLASDDWSTRAAAQTRLVALAELAEPRLKRAAHDSEDAEVRARCDAAL